MHEELSLKDLINPGETLLWTGKPHKWSFILRPLLAMLPFVLLWCVFDFTIIGFIVSSGELGEIWWFVVPFFAIHLMPLWSFIGQCITRNLEYKNVEYGITDTRVICRGGALGIDINSIDFSEIDGVKLNVGALEKLFFHCGSVIVHGDNLKDPQIIFVGIKDYINVYKRLQSLSFDVKTDIEYPNALRPDNNPGYKTKTKDNPFEV